LRLRRIQPWGWVGLGSLSGPDIASWLPNRVVAALSAWGRLRGQVRPAWTGVGGLERVPGQAQLGVGGRFSLFSATTEHRLTAEGGSERALGSASGEGWQGAQALEGQQKGAGVRADADAGAGRGEPPWLPR
jgi:hypothetical protein